MSSEHKTIYKNFKWIQIQNSCKSNLLSMSVRRQYATNNNLNKTTQQYFIAIKTLVFVLYLDKNMLFSVLFLLLLNDRMLASIRFALATNFQRLHINRCTCQLSLAMKIYYSKVSKSMLTWWHLWKQRQMKFIERSMMLSMVKHIIVWWVSHRFVDNELCHLFLMFFFFFANLARGTWETFRWRFERTSALVVIDADICDIRCNCIASANLTEFL